MANELYRIVETRVGGYEALMEVFEVNQQSGALKILEQGVLEHNQGQKQHHQPASSAKSSSSVGGSKTTIQLSTLKMSKVAVIITDKGRNSLLLTKWTSLAQMLNIPDVKIENLKRDDRTGDKTLEEIIIAILKTWTESEGADATLENLCDTFEDLDMKLTSTKLKEAFMQ